MPSIVSSYVVRVNLELCFCSQDTPLVSAAAAKASPLPGTSVPAATSEVKTAPLAAGKDLPGKTGPVLGADAAVGTPAAVQAGKPAAKDVLGAKPDPVPSSPSAAGIGAHWGGTEKPGPAAAAPTVQVCTQTLETSSNRTAD